MPFEKKDSNSDSKYHGRSPVTGTKLFVIAGACHHQLYVYSLYLLLSFYI